MSAGYASAYFLSDDGLRLHYRDYARAGGTLPPLLCLHGLTRNSRDFAPLAEQLASQRRVIAPDLRGRGGSAYDPDWRNYHPARYVADTWRLLDTLAVNRVIVVGTSLGGWMGALMAHERPRCVAGVVLNDIGPELDPRGANRIAANAGLLPAVSNWDEALAATRAHYEAALPDLDETTWRWYTANTYRAVSPSSIDLNYDRNIGVAVRAGTAGLRLDPWELFDALADKPVLLLRGALSDILSPATVARMHERLPQMCSVTIPNRGHVPLLNEPEATDAIDRFLATVAGDETQRC